MLAAKIMRFKSGADECKMPANLLDDYLGELRRRRAGQSFSRFAYARGAPATAKINSWLKSAGVSGALDTCRVASGRGEMDVQIMLAGVGELLFDRLFQEDAFDQLPAGHHALAVEAAHR